MKIVIFDIITEQSNHIVYKGDSTKAIQYLQVEDFFFFFLLFFKILKTKPKFLNFLKL